MEALIQEFKEFKTGFETKHADLLTENKTLQRRLDSVELLLNAPTDERKSEADISQTAGGRLIEAKEFLAAAKTSGKARFNAGQLFSQEQKTLISSAAVGAAVSGVLAQERIPGIVPLPRRKLRIRDLFRSRSAGAGELDFIKQTGFTNAAYPQVEGSDKGESAITFSTSTAQVSTIAHWIPATRQILDDLPELARFVNSTLLYGLKVHEEFQLLRGSGVGEELLGLMAGAAQYAGTYNVSGDTIVDKIRHAILEMNDQDEYPTGLVLSPKDAHDADLIKDQTNGANTGAYVLSNPLGGSIEFPTIWNLAVVVSRAMPPGKFVMGDFANGGEIRDRQDAVIDVSDSHSDYFTKNKIAIRAEERVALPIFRSTAFMAGSI